jgi:MFS transporter, Spinster family, sphingosine-1-phosphate transporter
MSVRYRNYMLGVLLVVWAFNGVDGFALGLVMQDIKLDLHLTDTQLGLLTGIAFALLYSIMGIPLARWADRGNRVTILSLTALVWSALVALCGLARNLPQLLALRIGVGIGEAGCMPTSQSLISDYFSRAERPRAMAIFFLGDALGVFIGFFVAGWLSQLYGWRVMFQAIGLPGVALAVLVRLTLREPRLELARRANGTQRAVAAGPTDDSSESLGESSPATRPSLKAVFITLWSNRTFQHLLVYIATQTFFVYGMAQWQPAFLIRTYGLKSGELGTWLAVINGVAILVGRYWGGELASRFAANNESLQLKAVALAAISYPVLSACIYLVPNRYMAFTFMVLAALPLNMTAGPLYALVLSIVPAPMRAMTVAVILFCACLIGNGLGPLLLGSLSDALAPRFGEQSLRYAMLALCPGLLLPAWHVWRASKTVRRDLLSVAENTNEPTQKYEAVLRT